ncbi:MAG: ABC transporter substrate-binding protein [Ottowia sp.]|uniref:ABC transporter substrate-binding protein n=1 Tax=Ottowia sp. TaxID=1898956 RepID=UPI003C790343
MPPSFPLIRRTVLGAAALTLATLLTAPATAQPLEPIKVRLDWTPWANHAAFHLAQQKGWYRQAGFDVTLEDGNGSVTTVQIIGSNNAFDIGHAALAPLMIARDKGLPVKALAVFLRKNDIGVLVPTDSGITGPAQLKGKKIGYTAGSLEAPFIDAFLAAGKLTKNDVELVNLDASSKASTYAVGRTDAVFSTIPFVLPTTNKARASRAIAFADFGLTMPSFGLLVNESKWASRGEALSRFASVTARTWEYILAGHEDEGIDAIIAERPQARLDKGVLRAQMEALKTFFLVPAGGRVGAPQPQDWEAAVKTLSSVQLIGANRPAAEYYVAGKVNSAAFDKLIDVKKP